jgi:lysozyme family protein
VNESNESKHERYEQLEDALQRRAEAARTLSTTLKQDGSMGNYTLAAVLDLVEAQNILIRTLARRVRRLEERLTDEV